MFWFTASQKRTSRSSMEPKLNVERLDERAMPSGVPDPLLGTPLAGGPPAQTVPPTPRTPYETLTQTPLLLPDTTPVVPYVPDLGPPPPGSGNTFGPPADGAAGDPGGWWHLARSADPRWDGTGRAGYAVQLLSQ